MLSKTLKTLDARNCEQWREWLAKDHESESEVWLVFHKRQTGRPTIAYDDAVDEAQCFGWIDSLIKRIDDDRYARKFTPQKPDGRWSIANRKLAVVIAIAGLVVARPDPAGAQAAPDRFELGVQVSSAISSQFDRTDVGLGGRLSWHPVGLVGIESEINLYPGDFPDQPPFSRGRVEGQFGVTVGPGFGRVRLFARLGSGFLNVREAPRPYPCILIFPPPLSCELASGRTLMAFDVGGGVEMFTTRRTFVRVDAGDRLLKYPGPVFDNNRTSREDAFFSHDFRFAAGGGLRF